MRGDELLAAGTPESLDEAMLAYQGGLEVAREPGVDDDELPRLFEERLATVRDRLDPSAGDDEDESGEEDTGARARDEETTDEEPPREHRDAAAGEPGTG
jgi:hypothetical protein